MLDTLGSPGLAYPDRMLLHAARRGTSPPCARASNPSPPPFGLLISSPDLECTRTGPWDACVPLDWSEQCLDTVWNRAIASNRPPPGRWPPPRAPPAMTSADSAPHTVRGGSKPLLGVSWVLRCFPMLLDGALAVPWSTHRDSSSVGMLRWRAGSCDRGCQGWGPRPPGLRRPRAGVGGVGGAPPAPLEGYPSSSFGLLAGKRTTIQHWQLRDLVHCPRDDSELFTVRRVAGASAAPTSARPPSSPPQQLCLRSHHGAVADCAAAAADCLSWVNRCTAARRGGMTSTTMRPVWFSSSTLSPRA